jgi:hypothetical protein
MTRCFLFVPAVSFLFATVVPAQESKMETAVRCTAHGAAKGPEIRFAVVGKDLVVRIVIEGPANRQIVLTDFTIDDGTPAWDEPPIGVTKPRRPPRVTLRYLVLINRDLPGFMDKGLMMVPTPPEIRRQQRQEVAWRLPNYPAWGFRREDATFTIQASSFDVSSEQLRQAIPRMKQTIAANDERLKGNGSAP